MLGGIWTRRGIARILGGGWSRLYRGREVRGSVRLGSRRGRGRGRDVLCLVVGERGLRFAWRMEVVRMSRALFVAETSLN